MPQHSQQIRGAATTRTAIVLAVALGVLALLITSCSKDEGTGSASAASGAGPTNPSSVRTTDACAGKPPAIPVDTAYLNTAKEQVVEDFPTQTQDEILEAIRKRNRHYLYVGYLERFPDSPRKAEVTCLIRDFGIFETPTERVLTRQELEQKYNFFGTESIARWNKGLLAIVAGQIIGAPILGTLQFLETDAKGGISVTAEGLKVPAGTKFIYPLTQGKFVFKLLVPQ